MTDLVCDISSQLDAEVSKPSKDFVCPQCDEGFRYRRHYDKHVEGHVRNNCRHCGKLFTVRKKLAAHLFDEHKIELKVSKYCCRYCDRKFAKKISMLLHYRVHAEGRHLCLICGMFFSSSIECAKHERKRHAYERPFKCEQCGDQFSRRQQYQMHVKGHEKYKCLTCNESFSAQVKLTEHIRKGHEVEEFEAKYKCEVCERPFHHQRSLVLHQRIHKKEATFNCIECGKDFDSKKSYSRHMNSGIHGGRKKTKSAEYGVFVCDICGKVFDAKHVLSLHVNRVHTGRKPKECNYCDYKSTSEANVKRHMDFHSEDRNFICEHCGACFYTLNALKEHHLYVHSEERNFHCSECGKSFKMKSGLNRHLKSHSERRPYECHCGQSYKRKSHLSRHEESSHSIVSKSEKLCKVKDGGLGRSVKVNDEGAAGSSKEVLNDSGTASDVAVSKNSNNEEFLIASIDTPPAEEKKLHLSGQKCGKSVSDSDVLCLNSKLNASNLLNLPKSNDTEPKMVLKSECESDLIQASSFISHNVESSSSRAETMASNVTLTATDVSEEHVYSLSEGETIFMENVYQCMESISGEELVSNASQSEFAQFLQGMHANVPVSDILQVVGPGNTSGDEPMIVLYLPSVPLAASNDGRCYEKIEA
ncbi:zinc finger protein 814-like isoform X2 [Ischnura elegans]|uniref:zinc finger protein 814-like isoform X2 n=1 Tax=Ischnura elegans TaxID=197161 RepID=UPI001ED884AD|nr:zinc finger protein 814-like isoform X2 [Ischnura elegans]